MLAAGRRAVAAEQVFIPLLSARHRPANRAAPQCVIWRGFSHIKQRAAAGAAEMGRNRSLGSRLVPDS